MTNALKSDGSNGKRVSARRKGVRRGPVPFLKKTGKVDLTWVTDHYSINREQLAETAGIAPTTIQKKDRSEAQKPQNRLKEMLEILTMIEPWAGGELQALAWYRSHRIPAMDDRTAEALVQEGNAAMVRGYIDHMTLGGYA